MNIKRAKEEIKNTIQAYLLKDEYGEYEIPVNAQRPVFLIGAPGIGKTQIMEQIARECKVGLVSYTITHHTRQSAIGLPFISQKEFDGQKSAAAEQELRLEQAKQRVNELHSGSHYHLMIKNDIQSLNDCIQYPVLYNIWKYRVREQDSVRSFRDFIRIYNDGM